MSIREIKKEALTNLQSKWKKAIMFVLCFILVEYILSRLLAPLGEYDMVYNSLDTILTEKLSISKNVAKRISTIINHIANISQNMTFSESPNYSITSLLSWFSGIILIMLGIKAIFEVPLSYAFTVSFMKLKKGENIKPFSFLENEQFKLKRAWAVEIRRIIKLLVPIIAIIIIYIRLAFNYTEILKIQRFMELPYFQETYSSSMNNYTIRFIIDILLVIASAIYYYIQKLHYVLSFKIAFDEPNLSGLEVVEKSKALMKGHRKEYFLMQLSFIGWEILSPLTLCIGYLWLIPYIQVSMVCFYDKLKELEQNNTNISQTGE